MPFRIKSFCILAATFLVTACTETTVEPTSGAITGTIMPAMAASQVYLIKGTDTIKTAANPDGTYEITEVTPGDYTLSAKPNYGFTSPNPGPIVINAGFTTQAYPIRVPAMPATGIFSVTLQDSVFTGRPVNNLLGQPGFTVAAKAYLFRFQLPKISGTGSFSTATHQDLQLEVQFDKKVWVANRSQGNMTLNVTYFDPVTRRGDATFSFTVVRAGEKDLVGTKGSLQFLQLR